MSAFTSQISDHPMTFPKLKILETQDVTSALRRPHPMRSARRARLRQLRRLSRLSVLSNFLPSSAASQFPTRTPKRLTPLTRRMPAARSGLSRPQSDASYASRRIAANLKLIVEATYGCCSSAILYRVTTVLLKASLGSEQYHSMNSRMACSQERFELAEVRLFGEGPPFAAAKSMIVSSIS